MRQLFHLPLSRRDDLANGYHVLWFEAAEPIAAEPGHFAMVRADSWGQAPLLARPMSLLAGGREPGMLIKVVGDGTTRMAEAAIGSMFSLLAPLGKRWPQPPADHQPLLVAGGVGVAPLLYLAEELAAAGHRQDGPKPAVVSLYGGRTQHDLPLHERLAAAGLLEVTTEDGSRGERGRITLLLERRLQAHAAATDAATPLIYTCGPHAMMAAVSALAERFGVPCFASLEAPMGCGYGVCLGCPVARRDASYLYACVDGPCVDAGTIDWSKRVFA